MTESGADTPRPFFMMSCFYDELMGDIFKTCNTCKKIWRRREDFLSDREIEIIGYQRALAGPDQGFFYFNHNRATCHTTLAILVQEFSDLYDGPLLEKHRTGSKPCPTHCFYKDNFSPRPEACECRYVRYVMQRIKDQLGK